MNDEAARQGRSDADHVTRKLPSVAALLDPLDFRHELPVGIRRAYEWGEISGEEVWTRLARLWGLDEVIELVAGGDAA